MFASDFINIFSETLNNPQLNGESAIFESFHSEIYNWIANIISSLEDKSLPYMSKIVPCFAKEMYDIDQSETKFEIK